MNFVSLGSLVSIFYNDKFVVGKIKAINNNFISVYITDESGAYTVEYSRNLKVFHPHTNKEVTFITTYKESEERPEEHEVKDVPFLEEKVAFFSKEEEISKPKRYNKVGNLECWDVILDQKMDFLEGSILKYLWRYKEKNGIHDLEKAKVYIDKIIEELKRGK